MHAWWLAWEVERRAVMNSKQTTVTYLQMFAPPARHIDVPAAGVRVEQITPSIDQYLALYRAVGGEYHWVDRLRLASSDLQAILNDPSVEVFLLTVNGIV